MIDLQGNRTKLPTNSYIFLDESGKPEIYSQKGINLVSQGLSSKHLVLVAVRTEDQLKIQQLVMNFKAQLLSDPGLGRYFSAGYTLDAFHAQKDQPEVRQRFYEFISSLQSIISISAVVIDKSVCTSRILNQNPRLLYGYVAGNLLKPICHLADNNEVIFSRMDSKLNARKVIESEVERLRLEFADKHPHIMSPKHTISYKHNPHYTHGGLQIADYAAYAIFQHYENQKDDLLKVIYPRIHYLHELFNNKHFTQSKPLQLSG